MDEVVWASPCECGSFGRWYSKKYPAKSTACGTCILRGVVTINYCVRLKGQKNRTVSKMKLVCLLS